MTLETIKAIKEYGTLAICVIIALYFREQLNVQEQKIERIESKLYDCFEQRIQDNVRFGVSSEMAELPNKIYAILPEEIRIRNGKNS